MIYLSGGNANAYFNNPLFIEANKLNWEAYKKLIEMGMEEETAKGWLKAWTNNIGCEGD